MNVILGATNAVRMILGRVGQLARAFKFDASQVTFTPGMAKRNSAGPFAAGVLVQGMWADATGSDLLSCPRGTQIMGNFYAAMDVYQGSIVVWVTPEWSGNDGLSHTICTSDGGIALQVKSGVLWISAANVADIASVSVSSWVAGTTYCVVARWDSKNTLDGTNHCCLSVNDTHTFGRTTPFTPQAPGSTGIYIGRHPTSDAYSAQALIEGLTIYRRPLFDGTYGVDVGNGDELNLIYNAGTGKDPTEITGSWDVVFCLPTNATAGALTTGTGEAWSHPHSSNVLQQWYAGDRYYGGGTYALGCNGTSVNCGSGASLDDVYLADNTVEGWAKINTSNMYNDLIGKGSSTSVGFFVRTLTSGGNTKLGAKVNWDVTPIESYSATNNLIRNGEWFHWAIVFDAASKTLTIYINGANDRTTASGSGNYISDAASNLALASAPSGWPLNGALGWTRISNTKRYTANFVPPRTLPAPDANTVEQWSLNEGTGTTALATVNAANNGAISNGAWQAQWEDVGSPVTCPSVEFNGASTAIDCGSETSIDDLQDNEFTAEMWVRTVRGNNHCLFAKGSGAWGSSGWTLQVSTNGALYVFLIGATTSINQNITGTPYMSDNRWHHVVMYFNNVGDRKIYAAVDGIWYTPTSALVGAITSDAGGNLYISRRYSTATDFISGAVGWTRISNNARYTPGTNFMPPARTSPPANDANTVRLFAMNEGAGTVITDSSTNAQNGTLSNGTWNNSRSLYASSGEKLYLGGYEFGSDAANEGITQTKTNLAAGSNYVLRPVLHYDRNAVPQIKVVNVHGPDTGSDLVTNGGFDSDTTGWTAQQNATLASVAGGESGNCLQITNGAGYGTASCSVTLVPGKHYRVVAYIKVGSYAAYEVNVSTTATGFDVVRYGVNATGAWTRVAYGFTASATSCFVNLRMQAATAGLTGLFDSITLYECSESEITSLTCPNQQANLVTNGGFDSDTTGWTANNATPSSVAGGVSGNCLQLVSTTPANGFLYAPIQLLPNARYVIAFWQQNAPDWGGIAISTSASFTGNVLSFNNVSNTSWGQSTFNITAPGNGLVYVQFYVMAGLGRTTLFDSITLTRVIDSKRPFCEPFSFELPTVARNGAASDCTAIKVQVLNTAATGMVSVHQVELLSNLLDNPSLETGSGDPWIPDGWGNYPYGNVLAGDISQEASQFHSGSSCLRVNASCTASKKVSYNPTTAIGQFLGMGAWLNGSGVNWIEFSAHESAVIIQASSSSRINLRSSIAAWLHKSGVTRVKSNGDDYVWLTGNGIVGYVDDTYLIALDPITLTVTPASLTNSTETTGLRVDGNDTAIQMDTDGAMSAASGTIKWAWTPRHSADVATKYGVSQPSLLYATRSSGSSADAILVYFAADNTMALWVNYKGTYATAQWLCTGAIVAGTTYQCEVTWTTSSVILKMNGTTRISVGAPFDGFTEAIGRVQFGGSYVGDATFAAPTS